MQRAAVASGPLRLRHEGDEVHPPVRGLAEAVDAGEQRGRDHPKVAHERDLAEVHSDGHYAVRVDHSGPLPGLGGAFDGAGAAGGVAPGDLR